MERECNIGREREERALWARRSQMKSLGEGKRGRRGHHERDGDEERGDRVLGIHVWVLQGVIGLKPSFIGSKRDELG